MNGESKNSLIEEARAKIEAKYGDLEACAFCRKPIEGEVVWGHMGKRKKRKDGTYNEVPFHKSCHSRKAALKRGKGAKKRVVSGGLVNPR